jgi:UDP-N-acetyl-D-mannosaminuronate dehydrogenase
MHSCKKSNDCGTEHHEIHFGLSLKNSSFREIGLAFRNDVTSISEQVLMYLSKTITESGIKVVLSGLKVRTKFWRIFILETLQ